MKKISSLIAILLCAVTLFAQAPEKFTYQAVVRNASNSLVANAQVGVRMNILQGSASGNAVYSETHMATTNANGLITVNIGGGSVLHGIFASIDWANGPYFLKTDIDPNGGNDYSITSVQQLLSVPYALYAKDAGNGFSGDYNDLVNVPQIPADISAFNNDAGYITSYTETDPQYNAWNKDYNDLINKPTIPTVPTNVSAFTNDAGYITLNQVPAQVNADWTATSGAALILNKPTLFSGNYNDLTNKPNLFDGNYNSLSNKPNLSTVAISGSYNDLINKPSIPTTVGELTNNVGYITLAQVPAQVNADWNATTGAAQILNKPTIPTVPTNVSAFTNDAGYITSAAIPAMPTNVSAFTNDAGYVTAAEVQQVAGIPTVVSAFQNDAGYITAAQVPAQVNADWNATTGAAQILNKPTLFSGNYYDLTNKPTIPTVPTNVSAFTNDAGYITMDSIPAIPTVPTNVSAFTNDAGYLTSYTEQQVLSISNDTIFITGGSFVKLPEGFSGSWNDLTDKPENISVPDSVSAFVNDAGYITMDSVPTIPTNVSVFENDAHYITDVQLQQIMSTIFTMQNTIDSMGLVIEALYNQINLPDSTQEMTDTSLQVTFTTTGYTNEPAVHQSDLSGTNFIHNGAGTNGLTGDVNDWWIFVSDRRSPSDYTTYIYANKPVSGFIVKRWSMGEWVDMSSQLYKFSITSNSSSSTITFKYYDEDDERWEVETSLYAIKFVEEEPLQVTFTSYGYTNEPAVHQSDLSGTTFFQNYATVNGLTGNVNEWWIFESNRKSQLHSTYVYTNKTITSFSLLKWNIGVWQPVPIDNSHFRLDENDPTHKTIIFEYYNEDDESWQLERALYAIKFND